jgi:predicted enzyme related to lactoylglutathione lyase
MTTRYVHTNLVARDWRRLADFYEVVFDCVRLEPERDLHGEWVDRATGLEGTHIRGCHMRLPGLGETGPTLEIFTYDELGQARPPASNHPGYGHLAFAVDDVDVARRRVHEHGGSDLGEVSEVEVPGKGLFRFAYLLDPEGNVVEVQCWS